MSNLNNEERNKRKQIFNDVFHSHLWGNRNNSGKNYKRPYSKTNSSAKEHMKGLSGIGPMLEYTTISGAVVSEPVPFGSN